MGDTPPHRMVSPRPETENSGHRESDSRRGDLPSESPPSLHSRESSQSRNVTTEKSDDFLESSKTTSDVETHGSTATWTTQIMPGGGGVQQDGTASAVSKESSTTEEEQASSYKDEHKQETGGNPEGLASRTTSRHATEGALRAKASTHTYISGCTSVVGTIGEEIASSRIDEPERAQQKVSVAEHSSTECTEDSQIKSGSTMDNVEALHAASSRAADPSDKPAATAESRVRERESSTFLPNHWRPAPQEGFGHPVPYTSVAQRLLPILFRERQNTSRTIARETSRETCNIMQEMVADSRATGNHTILKCEQELFSSAARTSQQDAGRQAETGTSVSQNDQSETPPSEIESLAESQENPLECIINSAKESKHLASDFASQTSLEYKLSSPATVRSLDHEPESGISETFSQDRQNEPPKPSRTVPTDALDLSSQFTAKPPDYRQGQSSRSYIYPALHALKKPPISPLNMRPRKKRLMQYLTSAFSVVRKTAFEEQPPPLVEEAASSAELPDDSAGRAVKAEPSVPREISPPSATSAEQKKAPVSLQRLGKRRHSSDSESTGEMSGQPPASRRRLEETRGAGEPEDTSDESIPFPSVQTKHSFRPIEVAPVSAGSEMKVVRPVALRAPITAQTASKFVSGATNVSELAELAVGKLTDSASDRGTVATGEACSSDADGTSPCSTLSYSEETEETSSSSAYQSDSSQTTDDERGGANESSGSESDTTDDALEQFFSVQDNLCCIYSETSSDSSETSVNGRRGTVDGSGDTTSALDPDSSNTVDDKESRKAESDAARFSADRTSQHCFSEGYVGRTEGAGGSPTEGAGDSKTSISLSAEDAEGFGVLRDVEASHNHSEKETGNSPAD